MYRFLGLSALVLGSLTIAPALAQTDYMGDCPVIEGSFACANDQGANYFVSYAPLIGNQRGVVYARTRFDVRGDGSRRAYPTQKMAVGQSSVKPDAEVSYACQNRQFVVTTATKTNGRPTDRTVTSYSTDRNGNLIVDTRRTSFTADGEAATRSASACVPDVTGTLIAAVTDRSTDRPTDRSTDRTTDRTGIVDLLFKRFTAATAIIILNPNVLGGALAPR